MRWWMFMKRLLGSCQRKEVVPVINRQGNCKSAALIHTVKPPAVKVGDVSGSDVIAPIRIEHLRGQVGVASHQVLDGGDESVVVVGDSAAAGAGVAVKAGETGVSHHVIFRPKPASEIDAAQDDGLVAAVQGGNARGVQET